MRRKIEGVITKILNARFSYLFFTIMMMFLLRPFLAGAKALNVVTDVFLWAILISCVRAVQDERKHRRIVLGMAIVVILTDLTDILLRTTVSSWVSTVAAASFLGYAVVAIFLYLAKQHEVTIDMIMAAASEYVLIGILFAVLYNFVEAAYPGSFNFTGAETNRPGFLYFSFVTLTTTGYGDLLPLSPQARSLAALEAVVGQLYIAITVALLVSAYGTGRKRH